MMYQNQDQELVAVKVEVQMYMSRQDRERRERAQAVHAVAPDNTLDWRSYERHALPNRWRVR